MISCSNYDLGNHPSLVILAKRAIESGDTTPEQNREIALAALQALEQAQKKARELDAIDHLIAQTRPTVAQMEEVMSGKKRR